jgi:hypothetical protein
MQARLWTHPANPSSALEEIDVVVERPSPTSLRFRYEARGSIDDLILPAPAPPLRADHLWRTTCFEAFLAPVGTSAYREFNFSPSSQWAAYDFLAYRAGMTQAALPAPPEIEVIRTADRLVVVVALSLDLPDEIYRLGVAAVIEEQGGGLSYWAAGHPPVAPDFHHKDCFALELPAAGAP